MAIFTSVSRNEKRFEAFYLAYRERLYRLCRSFCAEEADVADLFQEVMLRIWTALPAFRGEAKMSTWAYRIAVNTATAFRKRQAKNPAPLSFQQQMLPVEDDQPDERLLALRRAIAQLQPIDRLLVSLQLEGLSYAEMATVSGLNTNQLGLRLHRAKKQLQKIMLPHGS